MVFVLLQNLCSTRHEASFCFPPVFMVIHKYQKFSVSHLINSHMSLENSTKLFIKIKEAITIEKRNHHAIYSSNISNFCTRGRMKCNKIHWRNFNTCRENGRETGIMALKNQKTAEALEIKHNLQSSQFIYSN